ncbi:hypothetical protein IC610_03350 [Chryseobacterium sp. GCR10]|uniref:Uncharacterized protein n=1 Tax=Chryseobacterium caseinilyticum TaxID=2771428 RepID=A0ABR8Z852_9FLAO|nr:hypothetical protein [Chryseobacterium caseinilyticum]
MLIDNFSIFCSYNFTFTVQYFYSCVVIFKSFISGFRNIKISEYFLV